VTVKPGRPDMLTGRSECDHDDEPSLLPPPLFNVGVGAIRGISDGRTAIFPLPLSASYRKHITTSTFIIIIIITKSIFNSA